MNDVILALLPARLRPILKVIAHVLGLAATVLAATESNDPRVTALVGILSALGVYHAKNGEAETVSEIDQH